MGKKIGDNITIVDKNPKKMATIGAAGAKTVKGAKKHHEKQQALGKADNEDVAPASGGKAAVQVVRTYPCAFDLMSGTKSCPFFKDKTSAKHCTKRYHWEFAPYGEMTYLNSIVKAVNMAQEYIYIEDQYVSKWLRRVHLYLPLPPVSTRYHHAPFSATPLTLVRFPLS